MTNKTYTSEQTPNPWEAVLILQNLKNVKRRGWILRGIPENICESTAGHTTRTTQAGLFYTQNSELIHMLMMHDWAEAISGDPTPMDKINPKVKHEKELNAMHTITKHLPKIQRESYMETWLEYEAQKTPLSILALQLDKLDAAVKAISYEDLGYKVNDFYPYTRDRLTDPKLIKVFDRLMQKDFPLQKAHMVYFYLLGMAKNSLE